MKKDESQPESQRFQKSKDILFLKINGKYTV